MLTREILEDRWDGMVYEREVGDDWSELMERLDKTLIEMYETLARREHSGEVIATASRPGYDGSGEVTSNAHDAVREQLIGGVLAAEAARQQYPKAPTIAA